MSTTFTHANGSVTLGSNPTSPMSKEKEKKQVRKYDSLGNPYTYTKGPKTFVTHTLYFENLTLSEQIDLPNFYDGVVDGCNELFNWVDGLGITRVVRFAMNELDITQNNLTGSVTLKLEQEL